MLRSARWIARGSASIVLYCSFYRYDYHRCSRVALLFYYLSKKYVCDTGRQKRHRTQHARQEDDDRTGSRHKMCVRCDKRLSRCKKNGGCESQKVSATPIDHDIENVGKLQKRKANQFFKWMQKDGRRRYRPRANILQHFPGICDRFMDRVEVEA